eukprot:jgi/Hompol1/5821/HPOL_004752-RA
MAAAPSVSESQSNPSNVRPLSKYARQDPQHRTREGSAAVDYSPNTQAEPNDFVDGLPRSRRASGAPSLKQHVSVLPRHSRRASDSTPSVKQSSSEIATGLSGTKLKPSRRSSSTTNEKYYRFFASVDPVTESDESEIVRSETLTGLTAQRAEAKAGRAESHDDLELDQQSSPDSLNEQHFGANLRKWAPIHNLSILAKQDSLTDTTSSIRAQTSESSPGDGQFGFRNASIDDGDFEDDNNSEYDSFDTSQTGYGLTHDIPEEQDLSTWRIDPLVRETEAAILKIDHAIGKRTDDADSIVDTNKSTVSTTAGTSDSKREWEKHSIKHQIQSKSLVELHDADDIHSPVGLAKIETAPASTSNLFVINRAQQSNATLLQSPETPSQSYSNLRMYEKPTLLGSSSKTIWKSQSSLSYKSPLSARKSSLFRKAYQPSLPTILPAYGKQINTSVDSENDQKSECPDILGTKSDDSLQSMHSYDSDHLNVSTYSKGSYESTDAKETAAKLFKPLGLGKFSDIPEDPTATHGSPAGAKQATATGSNKHKKNSDRKADVIEKAAASNTKPRNWLNPREMPILKKFYGLSKGGSPTKESGTPPSLIAPTSVPQASGSLSLQQNAQGIQQTFKGTEPSLTVDKKTRSISANASLVTPQEAAAALGAAIKSPAILSRLITNPQNEKKRPAAYLPNTSSTTIASPTKPAPDPVFAIKKSSLAGKPVGVSDTPSTVLSESKSSTNTISPQLSEFYESEGRRFGDTYHILRHIGSGGHSTVKLASRISDGTLVVLQINPGPRKIPLEIHMMRQFTRRNVAGMIKYFDHFEFGNEFIIVMEYLGQEWIDLYDYIEIYGPVNETHSRQIFRQVVETILEMHAMGYCHNDIKDENIMIHTQTRETKLIDFGSTTPLERNNRTQVFYGTKKFAAPEALEGSGYYADAQEVWALGTLLYVLLFKMDPFKSDNEIMELDIERRIQRLRTTHPSAHGKTPQPIFVSNQAVELLVALMQKNYDRRPAIDEILGFPFFDI